MGCEGHGEAWQKLACPSLLGKVVETHSSKGVSPSGITSPCGMCTVPAVPGWCRWLMSHYVPDAPELQARWFASHNSQRVLLGSLEVTALWQLLLRAVGITCKTVVYEWAVNLDAASKLWSLLDTENWTSLKGIWLMMFVTTRTQSAILAFSCLPFPCDSLLRLTSSCTPHWVGSW